MSMPLPEFPWNQMLCRGIFLFLLGVGMLGVGGVLAFKIVGWKSWSAVALVVVGGGLIVCGSMYFADAR